MRIGDKAAQESIKDTVKVLSRYGHGIGVRVYTSNYGEGDQIIREYVQWADIPVINMETDMHHPCQALADMLTIKEKIRKYEGKKYVQAWAYSPGALRVPAVPQENIMLMTRYGMDVVYARPSEFILDPKVIEQAKNNARESGGSFTETDNLKEALEGADVIYMRNHTTLNYGKIGTLAEQTIMDKYKGWTLTRELMDLCSKKAIVMHCLPVHRDYEIASDVLDGPNSVIYDEAENRLHVQKAVLSLVIT
jgi:N-acetylornithine carbamoyltransferase